MVFEGVQHVTGHRKNKLNKCKCHHVQTVYRVLLFCLSSQHAWTLTQMISEYRPKCFVSLAVGSQ